MLVESNLTPEIPVTLSVLVGEIFIRFGELERALITVYARIVTPHDMEIGIGKLKSNFDKQSPLTLGGLIKYLKKEFKPYQFDWINFDILEKLNDERNALVHDSLMQEKTGELIWQANWHKRKHRLINYSHLFILREAVVKVIIEINTGSLAIKGKIKTGFPPSRE